MSRLFPSRTLACAVLLMLAAPAAEAAKPGKAEVSVPDGAMTSPTASLSWRRVNKATFYQVQVFNKKDKQILSTTVTNSDGGCSSLPYCSLVPGAPFVPGPYRWRVRAANSDGSGPWSDYASFWVGGPGVFESPLVNGGIHEVVAGPQTVTQIEIRVPGPGAVNVTTSGLLTCQRINAAGTPDISTVVTDDPDSEAQGVQPSIIVFWSSMAVNDRLTHPQATGRVFPVDSAGKKTFYWRSNGFIDPANDFCTIYAAKLTAEYFPWGGQTEAAGAGAGAAGSGPAGTALAR